MKAWQKALIVLGVAGGALVLLAKRAAARVKTLSFEAAKNAGAGDPTNTIEVSTDKGVVGTHESGEVGVPVRLTVEIPADAAWVKLSNLNGSALQIWKYPTLNGIELTDIIETSAYFVEREDKWITDLIVFAIPRTTR